MINKWKNISKISNFQFHCTYPSRYPLLSSHRRRPLSHKSMHFLALRLLWVSEMRPLPACFVLGQELNCLFTRFGYTRHDRFYDIEFYRLGLWMGMFRPITCIAWHPLPRCQLPDPCTRPSIWSTGICNGECHKSRNGFARRGLRTRSRWSWFSCLWRWEHFPIWGLGERNFDHVNMPMLS